MTGVMDEEPRLLLRVELVEMDPVYHDGQSGYGREVMLGQRSRDTNRTDPLWANLCHEGILDDHPQDRLVVGPVVFSVFVL